MRRVGYALFGLAALSVVICVVSIGYAIGGPEQKRTLAWAYGIVNLGFAIVNTLLGFGLLVLSRSAKS
jgi:predicted exporter